MGNDMNIRDLRNDKTYTIPKEAISDENIGLSIYDAKQWAKNNGLQVESVFIYDKHIIDAKTYDRNNDGQLSTYELEVYCRENDFILQPDGHLEVNLSYDSNSNRNIYDKYCDEELKARFPKAYYNWEISDQQTLIKDKQTGQAVFKLNYTENGHLRAVVKPDAQSKVFDLNGNVAMFFDGSNDDISFNSWDSEYVENLVKDLQANISANSKGEPQKTKESLETLVMKINMANINEVLNKYKESTGRDLEDDIKAEKNLDKELKNKLVIHIRSCLDPSKVLAKVLQDDMRAKTSIGFPTTRKNIADSIGMINPDNVRNVIREYSPEEGEKTLISDLISERTLSFKERARYINHIMNQLFIDCEKRGIYIDDVKKEFEQELKHQENKWTPASAEMLDSLVERLLNRPVGFNPADNIAPNGKIDKDFKQGRTGDCWLVAAIKAIANTPKGLKILNKSIKLESNGDVTVTLKGPNKTYRIKRAELEGNTQLSTGDLDVRALEIAVNKYFAEERGVEGQIDINGNQMFVAFEILTGKGGFDHFFPYGSQVDHELNSEYYERQWHIDDKTIDNFNKPNYVACVSAGVPENSQEPITLKATNGEDAVLITSHAYAVSKSDSKYVYLINPWDSSTEIPVERKMFKEFFHSLQDFDL